MNYNYRQSIVATEGTIEVKSEWPHPEYGDPQYVEGPLEKSMFQGMQYALIFGRSSVWADQCVKADFTPIVYDYLKFSNPTKDKCDVLTNSGKNEPYVVQPISSVPTFLSGGKEVLWPEPAVKVRGNVKIIASGHFPSQVFEMMDASDCAVELYGDYTCGHVWRNKGGFGSIEGGSNNIAKVYSGRSKSATGVRMIGTYRAGPRLHSGCVCEVGNFDTGHLYVQPRRKVNGIETWTECSHVLNTKALSVAGALPAQMSLLRPTFKYADVMLDDFANYCLVEAESTYVCGPDNEIRGMSVIADPRIGWDTSKVPWIDGSVLAGTRANGVQIG